MSKSTKVLFAVLTCILCVSVGAAIYFGHRYVSQLSGQLDEMQTGLSKNLSALQSRVDALAANAGEGPSGPTQENDVTIAGDYVVRDTAAIAEAYRTGKTDGLSDKDKETLDMASAVLKEIIKDGMSDYDKELAVYEWMTSSLQSDSGLLPLVPTTQADADNPYGVLKHHNAVCVGYATTFRLFMQMMDIPCMVVHNTEAYHTWDLVQIGGHWYHTDIYSDAGATNYSHFNRVDQMQQMDQTWDTAFFPATDSEEFCYAVMNAVTESDVAKISAGVRKLLDEGGDYLAYRIPGDAGDHTAVMTENLLNRIQSVLGMAPSYGGTEFAWQWLPVGKDYVVSVAVRRYNAPDPADSGLTEKDLAALDDMMQNDYGDIETDESYEGTYNNWNDCDGGCTGGPVG